MKILILGGTKFVGRHITNAALAQGHTVTLFHRGRTNAELFPHVEKLYGDRDGGWDVLRGRKWDAVIDVNGYLPRVVRASAELLVNAVERYVFISTISVFAKAPKPGQKEEGKLETLDMHTLMMFDCSKAIAAGLRYRPLAEMVRDTLAWDAAENTPHLGLPPEREAKLLHTWHAQNSTK